MIRYALKSLFQDKGRLFLSVFGVAVAILLILFMEGILNGTAKQLTAYIDNADAQVFVAQDGVKNIHMAKSFIPASTEKEVESIKGVSEVAAINYLSIDLKLKNRSIFAYLIGWDQEKNLGGPWDMVEGKAKVEKDEVIIDKVVADKYGYKLGDKIEFLGKKFKIAGLAQGTFSMMSSTFFFEKNTFTDKLPPGTLSYLLVKTEKGAKAADVTKRINAKLSKAHAMTKARFSSSENKVTKKMGLELIYIMTSISIAAAIGVVALSIYSATLEKVRDFGILKAIGAGKGRLYAVVISQSLFSTLAAAVIGVLLSLGLTMLLKAVASEVSVIITLAGIEKALIIAVSVGVVAAYLPVRQIKNVDPVLVFKG